MNRQDEPLLTDEECKLAAKVLTRELDKADVDRRDAAMRVIEGLFQ